MTKIYCEFCEGHQPLQIDPMSSDKNNGDSVWGDLICEVCKLVIATITVDEPGVYEFKKTEPLTTSGGKHG